LGFYGFHVHSLDELSGQGVKSRRSSKVWKKKSLILTFSNEDEAGVSLPHDDALVITMTVANHGVHQILLDNRSSANLLYWPVFQQMKMDREIIRPLQSLLVGFYGEIVQLVGMVTLLVTVGIILKQTTIMVDFLVTDHPSAYNVILGRPNLNMLIAIALTLHLKMKFPTDNGAKEVIGDQLTTRRFYNTTLKFPNTKGTLSVGIKFRDETTLQQGEMIEEIEEILVDESGRKVRIVSEPLWQL
jgi:hypothetical protein